MLKNYLITALRNFRRNRVFTTINVLGLAVGIASSSLIFLHIQDELSYDKYHSKAKRIYRLIEKIDSEGRGEESSSNPFPAGIQLKEDYPELIKSVVRFFNFQANALTLSVGEKTYNEPRVFLVDNSVFDVFDFELTEGNKDSVLNDTNCIIITAEMARRYFGEEDPIGQYMELERRHRLKVTGILEPIPDQSHFKFDALISFSTVTNIYREESLENWIWNPCWTYLLLKDESYAETLESKFPEFIDAYYPDHLRSQVSHYLQPLTSIHFSSPLDYEIEPNASPVDLYVFALIAVFILMVAAINFMSLASAKFTNRVKEVGIRKAVGAYHHQLVRQFIWESLLMGVTSVALALCFMEISLPVFNQLANKSLSQELLLDPVLVLQLLGIGIVIGLVSGLYPAIFLSTNEVIGMLKGGVKAGKTNELFRKTLVVIQFAVSSVLIISTIVIFQQYNYLRKENLGFDKEQIVVIPSKSGILSHFEEFREQLLSHESIISITGVNEVPGQGYNTFEYNVEGMAEDEWVFYPCLLVDEYFASTIGIELVAGRDFGSSPMRDDSLGVLINEMMVKSLGWASPEDALGRRFRTQEANEKVIGVVKDFHTTSLKHPIRPFVLNMPHRMLKYRYTKYICVQLSPEENLGALQFIKEYWENMAPEYPFEYFYLSDRLKNLYSQQADLGNMVASFSGLAILIACLGLFALSSFTTQRRIKEIGIRKVMGASVGKVILLLIIDFVKLIAIATVIAWPIALWLMDGWLSSFAYHTGINWTAFLYTTLIITGISIATVIFQASKAAMREPVDAILSE